MQDLIFLKTSTGLQLILAPIGPGDMIWYPVGEDEDIGVIVNKWRTGTLGHYPTMQGPGSRRRHGGDIKLEVKQHLIEVYKGGQKVPLTNAEPGTTYLRAHIPRAWKSYGVILEVRKYPFFLPKPTTESVTKRNDTEVKIVSDINATQLTWEILPPGWWQDLTRLTLPSASSSQKTTEQVERLAFVDSLQPRQWYVGKDYLGHRYYYVAEFAEGVVAESAVYGNALYVLLEKAKWTEILSLTKRRALDLAGGKIKRVIHTGDWQGRLRKLVKGG